MVPVKGANALRGIGSVERVGAVGVVFTGAAVWDNFHSGYSSSEAWGRTGIDVGVSAAVIGIGLVISSWMDSCNWIWRWDNCRRREKLYLEKAVIYEM
ncbi:MULTISPECIES: hypothetical protein [Clostridium]|uniref:hypothetical protein n=1 Tax=Clostridium TaxID=1485 RepID=UPI00069F5A9F|nr:MULTISPECIES: hypothetical protein [Clostridium]KOF55781.1 hypothetical protein AGR56_18460 [Clostridium sp. DMHC 10]MCD2348830.1 hypothetical protein [Clostridium guangxiense]